MNMMHQIITDPEHVADTINSIKGDVYQIIPFRKYDTDLFLILYEDYYSTLNSNIIWGTEKPKPEENQ